MPVVVHLSDVHFGAHDDAVAERLLDEVSGHHPDLVVVSGDLTQRATRAQFARARRFLDRLPGTVLTVVGNHDLPLVDLPLRFVSGTRRYQECITEDLDPVVSVAGIRAVGLDSMPSWRWKAGHVSPRQADLVREEFAATPDGTWRVLVTHHPVLPDHRAGLVGRDLLVRACAEARVAVLLSGHTHTPTADIVTLDAPGTRRTALAVVAGTAVSTRTRGAPNAYGVLSFEGPMTPGATAVLTVRHHTSQGWVDGPVTRCTVTGDGLAAVPATV